MTLKVWKIKYTYWKWVEILLTAVPTHTDVQAIGHTAIHFLTLSVSCHTDNAISVPK